MNGFKLPLDIVPGTDPPVFRWKQVVDGLNGKQVIDHESALPPTLERAAERMVTIVKKLLQENAALSGQLEAARKMEDRPQTPPTPAAPDRKAKR